MHYIEGKNGFKIPALGFGTYKQSGEVCKDLVKQAVGIGYRHIDTASIYFNQKEIGEALKESGISRDEVFITSKVWHTSLHRQTLLDEVSASLHELQSDYIDLLLIHWPNKDIPLRETLEAMRHLQEEGKVKWLGASNITEHHLRDIFEIGIEIVNAQIELHPTFNQSSLKQFCDESGIVVTAYAPLGVGDDTKHPTITGIASQYSVSPAQVILSWHRSKNTVAIPGAHKQEHLKENIDSLSVKLTREDVQRIDEIVQGKRLYDYEWGEFDY